MAITNVLDELVPVEFYTALDPYYYTVDNRPLENLDTNIKLIAAASDASAGSADRAALSGASLAYSMLGFGGTTNNTDDSTNNIYFVDRGVYSGESNINGLELWFEHGFTSVKTSGGIIEGRAYNLPAIAVHDDITKFTLTGATSGQTYLVYATWRDSTDSDRVPSSESSVKVAELGVTAVSGSNPPPLSANQIAVMRVFVPAGATEILSDNITYLNYKDVGQTSNVLDRAKISFNIYSTSIASGLQNISLNGTDIDPDKIDAVEVFVQGVNQFNWSYNSVNNQITLESPLTETADVRVRQTAISLS
ncbi:hypothetical protein VPHD148_0253 [Vibrio phage D148]